MSITTLLRLAAAMRIAALLMFAAAVALLIWVAAQPRPLDWSNVPPISYLEVTTPHLKWERQK
jgi:hypothetical protein